MLTNYLTGLICTGYRCSNCNTDWSDLDHLRTYDTHKVLVTIVNFKNNYTV